MPENKTPLQAADKKGLTALQNGQRLLNIAAETGFDWPHWRPVVDKIYEEIDEIIEAVENNESQARVEEEVGDLLIIAINFARHLNVDAETAALKSNQKFERRFNEMLQAVAQLYPDEKQYTLEQMDHAWEHIKKHEKQKLNNV